MVTALVVDERVVAFEVVARRVVIVIVFEIVVLGASSMIFLRKSRQSALRVATLGLLLFWTATAL